MEVTLAGLTKRYNGATVAVDAVDLSFASGKTTVIVGPSGSGKSTLLNLAGGLLRPSAGRILFDRLDVTEVPPERRNIGFVFQSYALFPHLTVLENVAFGLNGKTPGEDRRRMVEEMLALFGISALRHRRPAELSGGERQRVAIARALARRPGVLLLDEPLSALDAQLRERLRLELRSLFGSLQTTTVYVTHDRTEAMLLGHSVAVMREGRVLQHDAPDRIYRYPSSVFVARFFGDANLVEGALDGAGGVSLPFGTFPATPGGDLPSKVTALIRPEMFVTDAAAPHLSLRVESAHFIGSRWRIEGSTPDGLRLLVDLPGDRGPEPGDLLPLRIQGSVLHVLQREGMQAGMTTS